MIRVDLILQVISIHFRFFDNKDYKEYLESAVSFNRKLNEERKMRLPYIDSQTGVAQRHYNSERLKRERMPGQKMGQIYTYPQKHWRKKKYQYLKYFLQPKRFDPEAEMHTISQVENPSAASSATTTNIIPPNEDSNTSGGQDNKGTLSFKNFRPFTVMCKRKHEAFFSMVRYFCHF